MCLWIVASMLNPGPLDSEGLPLSHFTNPVGVEAMSRVFNIILISVDAVALVMVGGAVASIFARLRSASRVERQQIKWFAYAATVPLAGAVVWITLLALTSERTANGFGGTILVFGIALLPVAIGIAILRHNLYDIDRLINRTLVYGSMTVLLGLGFTGCVVLFQIILSPFTSGNDFAIAGSTLLIFALLRPIRQRLQSFVDRRFYRRAYDAARTVEAFSAQLREHSELDTLRAKLLAVDDETMQPATASLWLRDVEARR